MSNEVTRLYEAKANLTRTDQRTWFVLYAELMTRAVEQLATFVDYDLVYTQNGKVRKNSPIDPDVVELLG